MFVYRRRRRRIGHDSRCVYIYIFSRIFIFRLPLFAHLNILFLITALWPLLCNRRSNKKRTTTQCATRDFTAVAYLRQISIITKLLFFSALGRKTANPSSYCWWRVIFCIFCFLLLFLLAPSSSTFSCCRPETLISFFLFS